MNPYIVKLDCVNKSYHMGNNALHVLKNINLYIEKGEFIAILGTSGSGKSTLMNMIGCMDTLDDGTYYIDDIPIHECSESELSVIRNERIGFVFQKYQLIPKYSVLQNVMMPLLIKGMTRKEATVFAKESIERVGLLDRVNHKPNELSGGQQQRAAIARALVTKPALLLADEPTGALDSVTGKEILTLFQELNKEGNTIIIITHDHTVAENGSRIVHLEDGVITEEKPTRR